MLYFAKHRQICLSGVIAWFGLFVRDLHMFLSLRKIFNAVDRIALWVFFKALQWCSPVSSVFNKIWLCSN